LDKLGFEGRTVILLKVGGGFFDICMGKTNTKLELLYIL